MKCLSRRRRIWWCFRKCIQQATCLAADCQLLDPKIRFDVWSLKVKCTDLELIKPGPSTKLNAKSNLEQPQTTNLKSCLQSICTCNTLFLSYTIWIWVGNMSRKMKMKMNVNVNSILKFIFWTRIWTQSDSNGWQVSCWLEWWMQSQLWSSLEWNCTLEAVSGSRIPPMDLVGASIFLTSTRSSSGISFFDILLPLCRSTPQDLSYFLTFVFT